MLWDLGQLRQEPHCYLASCQRNQKLVARGEHLVTAVLVMMKSKAQTESDQILQMLEQLQRWQQRYRIPFAWIKGALLGRQAED